ncbi:MAG: small ribosomal subunit Rsm22 family protein [Lachnospiraceae bacterium]|nr:small ribosomal subunit Rsm22 family protein [Lachnospiraceae bacterium]
MNIPFEMQDAIEKLLEERSISKIRDCVSSVCERYNNDSGRGKVLVKNEEEAVSYAISRMPGTFGAVKTAVRAFKEETEEALEDGSLEIKSLADIGAGTGAAVWAAASEFDFDRITCFERESSMIATGKHMLAFGEDVMKNAAWIQGDAVKGKDGGSKADLVTASYIMNELRPEDREGFLKMLWETADKAVILLEHGTKVGFQNVLYARDFFTKNGASVVAPCTFSDGCPLPADDWCHFTCRMQRSKVQKFVKGGDAPYEDEKFSYIAVLKTPLGEGRNESDRKARIIRHPITNKGCVEFKLCSKRGIENAKVTSRDKEQFKAARKAEWGDKW